MGGFARQKLTPLQQIGGADYDSEEEESDKNGKNKNEKSGYESDPGRGYSTKNKRKPMTYAEFLKSQERNYGPQGAIDATKSSEAKHFKKEPVKRSRSVGSLVDVLNANKDMEEERSKQLRTIESNMALARSQKRDLRRLEGDLNKHQYSIKKSLQKFESVMSSRMSKKDDQIRSINASSDRTQQQHAHTRKGRSTARGEENRNQLISRSRDRRKAFMQLSNVEKSYKAKLAELNLKQLEIQRLTQEFTQKIKTKEEEEYRLKKELADLSLAVGFELKKRGTMEITVDKESQKMMKKREREDMELESGYESSKEKTVKLKKKTEHEKQSYSKDIEKEEKNTNVKRRETGRSLTSNKIKIEDTRDHLNYLQNNLDTTHTDIQHIQLQKRLKAAGDRKLALSLDVNYKTDERLNAALLRAWNNEVESQKYVMDDVKVRVQKYVSKRQQETQKLSQGVKTLGLSTNNQEQICRNLEKKLEKIKVDNQRAMLETLQKHKSAERKLEEEILNKKGELISLTARRDDTHEQLVKQNEYLRNDKLILGKIDKESRHLVNVARKTEEIYS